MLRAAAVSPDQKSIASSSMTRKDGIVLSSNHSKKARHRLLSLKERASSIVTPKKKKNPLDLLHDDVLITIGEHVGKLLGAPTYVRFALACRRTKRLLLPPEDSDEADDDEKNSVIANVIRARIRCFINSCPLQSRSTLLKQLPTDQIKTLEQLALFELWYAHPFSKDNRICFHFASVTVLNKYMEDHIARLVAIMKRFPSMSLQLDAHCGAAAPHQIAMPFSEDRGDSVQAAICGLHGEQVDPSRIDMIPWGKRIACAVARSDHVFGDYARQGKGWVEVFFQLSGGLKGENLVLPTPPDYYNVTPEDHDDDDSEEGYDRAEFLFYDENDEDESESDDSEESRD
ncbi:MAG: hypothetical protein SGILL_002639 [Bacillariaceae sp.]